MTKEESTKIVNFMSPGIGVLVLGRAPLLKMLYFFSSSCLHWGRDETNEVYSNNDRGWIL